MERDPRLTRMMKEHGTLKAPDGLASKVMDRLSDREKPSYYRPLIGRGGAIIILVFLAAVLAITLVYAESQGGGSESAMALLKSVELSWDWEFLSGLQISGGVAAVLLAALILVLADRRMTGRRVI